MEIYNELINSKDYLRQLLTNIGDTVDRIISSGFNNKSNTFNLTVSVGLTVAVKASALSTMTYDVRTIFNSLNTLLKKELTQSNEKVKDVGEVMQKKRTEFKVKIHKQIDKDMKQRVKTAINQNITAPTLKYIANRGVSAATNCLKNKLEEHLRNKRENEFAKEAIKLTEESKQLEGKTELTSQEELQKQITTEKMQKIKGRTSINPETYALLVKSGTPMGAVELKATAKMMNIELVVYDKSTGLHHTFGEAGAKRVEIDLKDGHFPNSSDGAPITTNDCLFYSLKDKIDMGNITPEEFRSRTAEIIVKDPEVRAFVADPRRKFYSDMGFYGGKEVKNYDEDAVVSFGGPSKAQTVC